MIEQTATKKCSSCKKTKLLSEFYKHPKTTDKHDHHCKECAREYARKHQSTTKGKKIHNRASHKYAQSPKGKVYYQAYHQTEKAKTKRKLYKQTKQGKEAVKRGMLKSRQKYPFKWKARYAVSNAIKAGKLPHPNILQCHYCPAQAEQYHHWCGYAPEHRLEVVPVCIECHSKLS